MIKNSGSQVYAGREPTRERVGLVVDGTNAALQSKQLLQQKLLEYARYG